MSFEVLVSTMHKDASQVQSMLKKMNVKCDALVIVQGDKEGYEEIRDSGKRIKVIFSKERGLSKSRNLALNNCDSDYAYIMDDDVVLEDGALENVVKSMVYDSVDVGTTFFKYENGKASKPIHKLAYDHNLLTAARVCSIEMCVNVASLRRKNIGFDEGFGLGAEFESGEEYILLADCLQAGLKVRYYPVLIGVHPDVTSGQDFYTSPSKTLAKREMFKRVFGWKSFLFIIMFWLKKTPKVARKGYFLAYTKSLLFGLR